VQHLQESTLFFTALNKVREYAAWAGHLPTIVSENVQGRRFRRWDEEQVCCDCTVLTLTLSLQVYSPVAEDCQVVQERWSQPFLKVEADALLAVGYRDLGWREVSTEAFGLPNPKHHIILIATEHTSATVDCCLFSTVRNPHLN
jgi:hypothetical protein